MSSCHEQLEERLQLTWLYQNVKKTLSVVEEDSWEDKDISTETEKVLKKFFLSSSKIYPLNLSDSSLHES